jgi:dethiobiotin synthetase
VAPLVFEQPLAPSVAARLSGAPLEHRAVLRISSHALEWWSERVEVMVVEGVGGLLCPLAEATTVADLASSLDYPLVIVAKRELGTLNHTLLTVEAARGRGLRIAGLVLNSPESPQDRTVEATNAEELARRLDRVALLAILNQVADCWSLSTAVQIVDWYGLARAPRWTTMDT